MIPAMIAAPAQYSSNVYPLLFLRTCFLIVSPDAIPKFEVERLVLPAIAPIVLCPAEDVIARRMILFPAL